jgi:hypothetical protein
MSVLALLGKKSGHRSSGSDDVRFVFGNERQERKRVGREEEKEGKDGQEDCISTKPLRNSRLFDCSLADAAVRIEQDRMRMRLVGVILTIMLVCPTTRSQFCTSR